MSIPRHLRSLPSQELPGGVLLMTAATPRARLVGLTGVRTLSADQALLLPRCRSVHTFGMRFALDLIWLDGAARLLRQDAAVAPGRIRGCRSARAVVETAAGAGDVVAAALAAASGDARRLGRPSIRR
jgi:uncharacterized membrane protein (UPF0127 family)